MIEKQNVTVLLFEQYELLDVFGPLQMFGLLPEHYRIQIITVDGQPITSTQGVKIMPMLSFKDLPPEPGILLIPGGVGIRFAIHDPKILTWLRHIAPQQHLICSVCTGAGLLANAGLLDNGNATTNKKRLDWVSQFGNNITWKTSARWVQHNNIFTASGTSSGIDMSLAVIGHQLGDHIARRVAVEAEYLWLNDPNDDPFAPLHLVK